MAKTRGAKKRRAQPRDTYKYELWVGNKKIYIGVTNDLERRLAEHRERWPKARIKKVGAKSTRKGALEWERGRSR